MSEPKLRFKADDGNAFPDWEEKKLGDVCDPLTYGMNAAAVKFDGKNKYIRITDIDDKSHRYVADEFVSPDGELDDKYLVSENDILLARTGASVGKSYIYDKKDGKLYYAGFLIKAHVKSGIGKIIFYQTLTDRYNKWVKVMSVRSGQPGINANEYSDFMVFVPSLPEQQKIADFLSTIDTVIETQKATVEAWEERKKGVMQKLFSQEVRFKADDGSEFPEWEEKKLGDVADFFNGDRSARYPKETDFVKYGVAFLNTENLHNTIVDISEKCKYITYEKYCELSGAKIQLLDIIYCLRGSVGLCSLNTILEEGTVASSLMVIRAVDGIIDPIYLYNSLNSDFVLGQLYQCLNGSCAGNLSAKDMAMFKIKCPCLAEQQKIADCLSSLDEVIEKQKATLVAWEKLKKGLLQQMFV